MTLPPQVRITRPPHPEQLDTLLKVVPSFAWISLLVLLGATVIALLWSIFSTAPIKSNAEGILLNRAGVADVAAPASGRVMRVLVKPGDHVHAGQVVGYLAQPELEVQLQQRQAEVAKLQERASAIRGFLSGQSAARGRIDVSREGALRERVAALRRTEATLAEMEAEQEKLLRQGIVTRERVLTVLRQLEDARAQMNSAKSDLVGITSSATNDVIASRREMLEVEMNIASARRDVAVTEHQLRHNREIVAPLGGVVAEELVNIGEVASAGASLLRVLPGNGHGRPGTLVAILYVPPANDSHAVKVGMTAQIMPNSVRVQRDGFIRGRVIEVSSLPSTPEGMTRVLKNQTLVQSLSQKGAPVQAVVELEVDPSTISGFRWSGGRGPARRISAGTIAEGKIVTDRIPMIALVVPKLEGLLAAVGL